MGGHLIPWPPEMFAILIVATVLTVLFGPWALAIFFVIMSFGAGET